VKADTTIRRNLRGLQRLIDDPDTDPLTQRVAYAMETAIRWITENTRGWPAMPGEAKAMAALIRQDMGHK
jgi:hypothetical protein